MMNKTPQQLGYRIPAEWEKHEATWIAWPHNKEDWPGKFIPINWVYAEIVRKIIPGEIVNIIVESKKQKIKVKNILTKTGIDLQYVNFFLFPTNRSWMRDSGPAFIKNISGEVALVNFRFNAWAKYDNWKKDITIPGKIGSVLNKKYFVPLYKNRHIVLEGGSIDINGNGTLITTEECLMDNKIQVRNQGLTKEVYEKIFFDYLGISNVFWLGKGIAGDDTHGHIDDLCRFVNPDTILLCNEENPDDENYIPLKENFERIEDMKLEDGSKPEIIPLPMPEPLYFEGIRLPASYANFYIANQVVLVPTFNDPKDRTALGILSEVFTDREVVGIHSVDLVWGLGTIHCLTREEPA